MASHYSRLSHFYPISGARLVWKPIPLLFISTLVMTYAWYGHLKDWRTAPLGLAILASWSIAFFDYRFQVSANRLGIGFFRLPQRNVLQEIITMPAFASFSVVYFTVPVTRNYGFAAMLGWPIRFLVRNRLARGFRVQM
jgi:uncharacterized protein (DUF486 family)